MDFSGLWWLVVACGGLWWLVVACGGLWWLVVACGGLWWLVVILVVSSGFKGFWFFVVNFDDSYFLWLFKFTWRFFQSFVVPTC